MRYTAGLVMMVVAMMLIVFAATNEREVFLLVAFSVMGVVLYLSGLYFCVYQVPRRPRRDPLETYHATTTVQIYRTNGHDPNGIWPN